MRSLKILSSALCAWLALDGCSLEDNSTPSVPVDASSQGGASGAGPSSSSGGPSTGAGGSAGAGGSSGGTTVVMMDASGMDDVAPPARDASNEASGDATPAAGDAGGCPGLFCEDFEGDQFDSTKWNVQTVGGSTAALETQLAAHGKHSAHFRCPGRPTGGVSNAYAYLLTKSVPAELRTHNFGRAYFYMTPKPTSVNIGLLFGGTAGFPRPTYMSVASHYGGWQLGFIKQMGSPGGEVQAYPVDVMPVATWMCLEWEFNDQPDVINFWRDGKVVGPLDPNHIDYPPGHNPASGLFNNMTMGLIGAFTDFGFGLYDWHPDQSTFPYDVYYDDIVLDTKRVGCL
jgi:hypothetical protein